MLDSLIIRLKFLSGPLLIILLLTAIFHTWFTIVQKYSIIANFMGHLIIMLE
jgi:hypothetical protein